MKVTIEIDGTVIEAVRTTKTVDKRALARAGPRRQRAS